MRSRVRRLRVCDLRAARPLADPAAYDLVTSFYCTEAACDTVVDWEPLAASLCGLVAPGGRLFVAAMRHAVRYTVRGEAFPGAPVGEADWGRVLRAGGFDPARTEVTAVAVADWADHGFDAICVVKAERQGAARWVP